MAAGMPGFVEVTVDATGQTQMVPEHFVGDPKLGAGLTVVEAEPVAAVQDLGEPPTDRDTHEVIDAYAHQAGIDLGEAATGTKAEKVAAIDAAVAAMPTTTPPSAADPDVQLVAGTERDGSLIPAFQANHTEQDDTESPAETPATGNEEN